MKLATLASFDVVHAGLQWPWITFDASEPRFAFAGTGHRIESRVLTSGSVLDGPSFALPTDVPLANVRGFSLGGELLGLATVDAILTLTTSGERRRTPFSALIGEGFAPRAIAQARSGAHLWVSAESATETAILLIDTATHELVGSARSAPFPPPATHELHLHPQDDAVLLLAACGEDGTFARVAGWSGGGVEAIATALDAGSIPAGFVGFSADVMRVHLAEADELRTHAWPGLEELSSVELADDFVSSFSGIVLGDRILVDGEEAETRDDAVMIFDRTGLRGALAPPPVPTGMWAGRLGTDSVVVVEAKGEPAHGRVVRFV